MNSSFSDLNMLSFRKSTERGGSNGPHEGVEATQTRFQRQQIYFNGHYAMKKAYGELQGTTGDGAGKRVINCEMCTENDEGGGGKRQRRLQKCRRWPDMH
jgi:hypothetical protein